MFGLGGDGVGTQENSRAIFGYLSKACPELESLTLHYRLMYCELDSGLCPLPTAQAATCGAYARIPTSNREPEFRMGDRDCSLALRVKHFAVSRALTKSEPNDVGQLALSAPSTQAAQGDQRRPPMNHEDPDYMVRGVDMWNLGRIRDITNLMAERQSKNGSVGLFWRRSRYKLLSYSTYTW